MVDVGGFTGGSVDGFVKSSTNTQSGKIREMDGQIAKSKGFKADLQSVQAMSLILDAGMCLAHFRGGGTGDLYTAQRNRPISCPFSVRHSRDRKLNALEHQSGAVHYRPPPTGQVV